MPTSVDDEIFLAHRFSPVETGINWLFREDSEHIYRSIYFIESFTEDY